MNIDFTKIEAIISDLGGVILDIDIEGAFDRFKSSGIGFDEKGMRIIKTNNAFLDFETGKISADEFRDAIRRATSSNFTNEDFDAIWNSMILSYPKENIRFLEKAKSKYRTYLMSNTNAIHVESYSKLLENEFGYKRLDELFEKAYYSHTSGMRKPNTEFFKRILSENNLNPETTLFIDDFIENIEAAQELNIQTYHIAKGRALTDLTPLVFEEHHQF